MQQQKYSDYQYVLAYAMIIAMLYLVAKTRVGYVTIYYSLMLFAFLLVLLRSATIVNVLKPLSNP